MDSAPTATTEKDKFQTILEANNIFDQIQTIKHLDTKGLIGKHFSSNVKFIQLELLSKEKVDLFVKTNLPCSDTNQSKMQEETMLREGVFLSKFLEKLNRICHENMVTSPPSGVEINNFFPKVLYYDHNEIIMRNLMESGFGMFDNGTTYQDFNHARSVMIGLGKFHAISYEAINISGGKEMFLKEYPLFVDPNTNPKAENKDLFRKMFEIPMESMLILLAQSKNGVEVYQKLKKYSGKWFDIFTCSKSTPGLIETVIHGDCWNNNLMFRENSFDKEISVVFVDFQKTRIASSSIDLSYYIFTSTDRSTRDQWKNLLQIYSDEFMCNLKNFMLVRPVPKEFTFENILTDFSNRVLVGLFSAIFMTIGFEAMSAYDHANKNKETSPDELSKVIICWIKENASKHEAIVKRIVDLVETCDKFNPKILNLD